MKSFKQHQHDTARDYLIALLEETHGNITYASRISGVHRTHLYRLFLRYDVPYDTHAHFGRWDVPLPP